MAQIAVAFVVALAIYGVLFALAIKASKRASNPISAVIIKVLIDLLSFGSLLG